MIVLNCVIN